MHHSHLLLLGALLAFGGCPAESQHATAAPADPLDATPSDSVDTPDVPLVPDPGPPPEPEPQQITAVWANEGGDKVTRDELRAHVDPAEVVNPSWDGQRVVAFGARGEVLGLNLVLEAAGPAAQSVRVSFDRLTGPDGATIQSRKAPTDGLFNWVDRPIELFYVRYLQIQGLSVLGYESSYDERHIPHRLRRPWTGQGKASGVWGDRPDADKLYPDILVPHALHPTFDIPAASNQSVWVDIAIPRDAAPGIYTGNIEIWEGPQYSWEVPIAVEVLAFAVPEVPSLKTMLVVATQDVNERYLGDPYPSEPALVSQSEALVDRHFMLAWRHRVSAVDSFADAVDLNFPDIRRLDGSLFTAKNGCAGPGEGHGVGLHVIGLYGGWTWQWDEDDPADMQAQADQWTARFTRDFPDVEHFLFLADEPQHDTYPQVEAWASWIDQSEGPGSDLPTFATIGYVDHAEYMPSVDIPCRAAIIGDPGLIEPAWQALAAGDNPTCAYGGMRPATGLLLTDEDGVGPRALAWTQYKHGVGRWFIWNATYYNDFQSASGHTDVFSEARTFGANDGLDPIVGETGWNYTNGDGVLMYPGTDAIYPEHSYEVAGPLASLRLKLWRRGLFDADYLTLAAQIDEKATQQIVQELLPKSLWGVGIETPEDPSYIYTDISWPVDPAAWENARRMLAEIIMTGAAP